MTGEARPVARTRTVLLALLLFVVLGYAAVALLYTSGGGLTVKSAEEPAGDVRVRVEVVSVQPGTYSALLRFRVTEVSDNLLNADQRIAVPLRISVTASDGTEDLVFPAGTALGRAEIAVGISGEQSSYPFDKHEAAVLIDAFIVPEDLASGTAAPQMLNLTAFVVGGMSGWDTTATVRPADSGAVLVGLEFVRSFSTMFFAILLVIMAFIIAAYSISVGTATFTGRQPVDSSIVGWGAALLFALLALRFYLPGEPPIGSGIDVFAYMWATLGAFIGLSMTVTMWLRREWDPPSG
ncbi:MAG: DUF4436 family protein [Actinobacteria bacterium]|nr:DUF4436 family protein [Actinomycetota bacterium]